MPPETPQTANAVLYWVLGGAYLLICSLVGAIYAANNRTIKKVDDDHNSKLAKVEEDMKSQLSEFKKDFQKQIESLTKEVKESNQRSGNIEHNYIKRFEDVNKSINQLNTNISTGIAEMSQTLLKAITSIQVDLAKNYVSKKECIKC